MTDISENDKPEYQEAMKLRAEFNGVYDIETLELIEGDLPRRARRLIREWAAQYQDELKKMWDTQEFVQLPGLE